MTGALYAIGRFCSRHHWLTIGVWIVLAVGLVLAGQAGESKTNDNLTLPGTGSTAATELLEDNLPEQAYGSNPLVFQARAGAALTGAQVRDRDRPDREPAERDARRQLGVSPLSPQGANFLSKDRSVAYIPVVLGTGPGELTEAQAQAVLDAGKPAEAAGLRVAVGSYVGQELSKPDTGASDAIGIAAAIVILLFAFGTATAMVLPIFSAMLGLACSLSIIRLLEHVVQVPSVASTLATMIGLGVGIDYALFIVTRHKLQLRRRDGAARVGRPRHRDRGRRRRLRRLHRRDRALLARLRRHPAGQHARLHRGDRGRDRGRRRGHAAAGDARGARLPDQLAARAASARPTPTTSSRTAGRRWARGVADRPWRSALAALAVLIVLAMPIFQLELGQNDISALPKSTTARQAYDSLTMGFGPGVNGPLLIASEFDSPAEAKQVLPGLEKAVGESRRRRRGLRTDPRQGGDGGGLHRDLQIGAVGGRDRRAWSKTCATRRSRRR